MAVLHVNDSNFKETLESITTPVFLKFGSPGCGPCENLSKTLQNLPAVREDKVTLLEIDTVESPNTAGDFMVMSVPVLLLFIENKQKDKLVGAQSEKSLKNLLQKHKIA